MNRQRGLRTAVTLFILALTLTGCTPSTTTVPQSSTPGITTLAATTTAAGAPLTESSAAGSTTAGSMTARSTTATSIRSTEPSLTTSDAVPNPRTTIVASGLRNPWDGAVLPGGEIVFTQRHGVLSVLLESGVQEIAAIPNVYVRGEGGLTGLALDHDFANNRYIYLAYNAQAANSLDVRVTRWKLSQDWQLSEPKDLVTGIPSNTSGRHSGTQLEMDVAGTLWIGTGDAADSENPQSPDHLGGKILRVDREGAPVSGNLPAPFDPRIFSYGHRNVQGLALFPEPIGGAYGYSVEHGSSIEDELNLLQSGNYGWAPNPPYGEGGVPMTDTTRFPDAIPAVWSSGSSTIATSGVTFLRGSAWGIWENAVVIGVQKGQHVHLLQVVDGAVTIEERLFERTFGRIRAMIPGGDGVFYFTTDNGRDDRIVRVDAG